METKTTNYKSIFKATSIFGGVQVFNILITLIRGKALAILIGTAGMGLNGLFMSGLNLIKTVSSLGIAESAIRDLSKAHASNNQKQMAEMTTIFTRWIWITAALGIVLTLSFAPLLSQFSFSSKKHTLSYMLLSLTFIFAALTGGIYAMLRATRQIKYLAQANIFGSVVGLMIALPIFYFYGIKGVVPAIIATSFATYLVSLAFRKNIKFEKAVLTWSQTWNQGKPMVMLGLSLTVISLLTAAVTFVLSGYISKTGSLHDLGLYNAGLSIVDGYVGMVFTAMAADYFPRLSGIIGDEMKWKQLVNEQAELILIILGMVLVLLITTTPILIRVLLSEEFLDAKEFIFWSVLSIPLKGLVWVMGFIVLAKGNNKLFLAVEVIAHLIILASNLIFYSYLGLTGLGISMLVSYFISFLFMLTITKSKYDFGFFREVYRLLVVVLLALSLSLVSIKCLAYPMAYLAEAVIVILTLIFGIRELNNRMNLKEIVVNIKSKISKKKDV